MLSIIGFLIVLGPLVIFHEFGHYIFARIFGVKAEIFSVGFGPTLWKRQIGETELRLSALPLGGYVKLLGEESDRELTEAELKRSLPRQAPWKRFFIFFGGPLFNFILATLVFMIILVVGEPQMASVAGRVVHGSPAEQAGLRSGDRITAVDSKPVTKFEEVIAAVNDKPGKAMSFQVVHGNGSQSSVIVTPSSQDGYSVYGEETRVGDIDGVLPMGRSGQVGVSDPSSLAAKAGVKTGDKVVAVNGKPVASWEELDDLYLAQTANAPVVIKVGAAAAKDVFHEIAFTKAPGTASFESLTGLHSSELFVERTVAKSPADTAGLKAGDRLVGIGSQDVQSFFELKDAVQKSGEKDGKVTLRWEHEGKPVSVTLTPTATSVKDPTLKKTTQFTVGVVPMLVWAEPVTVIERVLNPFMLVYKATERMAIFSWRNIVSIRKMITGEVSLAALGGPILIGKIAGESLSRGLIAVLTTMAVLSVGLGVLNVLPIPVLDGGHLLLLVIEAIRGKPLTTRQMEIVQQVGLSLILLLMVIVMRNDISRLPFFD